MMRRATSPRLAISIFLNMAGGCWPVADRRWKMAPSSLAVKRQLSALTSSCPDCEQPFPVLHRLAILHVDVHDFSVVFGVDLVHQFHRFDDAQDVALLHRRADLGERRRARLGR